MKPAGELGDGESDPHSLDVGVAHTACADEVGATDLAPDEIVGVVNNAHLVGLGVSYAKLDVVERQGVRVCHVAKFLRADLFVKRALRR